MFQNTDQSLVLFSLLVSDCWSSITCPSYELAKPAWQSSLFLYL